MATERSSNERENEPPESEFQWPPPREAIDRMFVRVEGVEDSLDGHRPRPLRNDDVTSRIAARPAEPLTEERIEPAQPDPLAYDPSAVERFSFEPEPPLPVETDGPEAAGVVEAAPTPALPPVAPAAESESPDVVAAGVADARRGDEPAFDQPPREHFSFEPAAIGLPAVTAAPHPRERPGPTTATTLTPEERSRADDRAAVHSRARTPLTTAEADVTAAARSSERPPTGRAPRLDDRPLMGRAISFPEPQRGIGVRTRPRRWPLAAIAILVLAAAAALPWLMLLDDGGTVSFEPSSQATASDSAGGAAPPASDAPLPPRDEAAATDAAAATLATRVPESEPAMPPNAAPPHDAATQVATERGEAAGEAADAEEPAASTPRPAPAETPTETAARTAAPRPREVREREATTRERETRTPARESVTARTGTRDTAPTPPAPPPPVLPSRPSSSPPSATVAAPAPTPNVVEPERIPASETAASAASPPPAAAPEPATAPAPVAASTTPATAAAASDEQLVSAALRRYARAYEQLDATAARRVWPNVDERALARAFDTLESQQFRFDACRVRVLGRTARADCDGAVTYVPKVGKKDPRTIERRWDFALRKGPDAWQITEATVR